MEAIQSTPKLPILPTIVSAWTSVPRNLGLAFRLYWPWLVINLACLVAWGVGIVANTGFAAPQPALVTGAGVVPLLLLYVISYVAFPAIAVGWHRGISTGERPRQPILLDSAVWGYIGYTSLIGVAVVLILALILAAIVPLVGIAIGLGHTPMSLERLLNIAPYLVAGSLIIAFILLSRFGLVLPSIAVGRGISLAESFRRTRGNTLRIMAGTVLMLIVFALVVTIPLVPAFLFLQSSEIIVALASLVIAVATFAWLHASLSFASLVFNTLAPAEAR